MSSRRDYVAIAEVLRKRYAEAENYWQREAVRYAVRDIARAFSDLNPRFSTQKFYAACACGLSDDELAQPDYEQLGRERGECAASWVFDGNTSRETYARVVRLLDDGDPEVYDIEPAWLSGEWAGESLSELRLDHATDEQLTQYEQAASEVFWFEVERIAREQLGCDDDAA